MTPNFRSSPAGAAVALLGLLVFAPAASAQKRDSANLWVVGVTVPMDSSLVARFATVYDVVSEQRPDWLSRSGVAANGEALPSVFIFRGSEWRPSSVDELRGLPSGEVRKVVFLGPVGGSLHRSRYSRVPIIQYTSSRHVPIPRVSRPCPNAGCC